MFKNQWKISFNIASEASYVYKLIKKAKNEKLKISDKSILRGQKLVKNAKIKIKRDILVNFQTMWAVLK